MSSAEAPKLIKDFAPDARIVCILRNPVDMVYAWHSERVHKGVEDEPDFATAFADDFKRPTYLGIGQYGTHLQRWLGGFGRDSVHAIVFDDFTADTPAQFANLLEFLDVDPSYRPASFDVHNAYSSKSRLVPILRAAPMQAAGRAVKRVAGTDNADRLSRGLRGMRMFQRGGARRPMTPQTRAELQDAFRAQVKLAGSLLERDLETLWFS